MAKRKFRGILKPFWCTKDRKTVRLYQGDVLKVLRRLPAKSVQCVVTSPPYWGLRDYGTDKSLEIGSEKTVEEFVAKMVEVFAEVRRVLRDDGTVWLNLGSSYASGGMSANPSPLLKRDLSCGNCDKESQCFPGDDRACHDSCDAPQGEKKSRRARNARSSQSSSRGGQQTSRKDRGIVHSDCDPTSLGASPPDAQQSTKHKSSGQPLDVFCPLSGALVSPGKQQTLRPDALLSEHNLACTSDTSEKLLPLVVRTQGKESFFSACQRSDCKGIGRCGLCWCSLALPSLKVKSGDEVNSPHLVALALQADGWVLRQTIIWGKPSPMPESIRNRCTKSHEYLFLLTKSMKYFYDAEAIKEKSNPKYFSRYNSEFNVGNKEASGAGRPGKGVNTPGLKPVLESRNKRSVWTIASESYAGAHFATFPKKLVEPCVLAGTSEKGACAECGSPWKRVVETKQLKRKRPRDYVKRKGEKGTGNSCANSVAGVDVKTVGWEPTCECGTKRVVPCVVLDPFVGSGTTCCVAAAKGRRSVGIDLSEDYLRDNAVPRIEGTLLGIPTLASLVARTTKKVTIGREIT